VSTASKAPRASHDNPMHSSAWSSMSTDM
jgi:hypothetical protein